MKYLRAFWKTFGKGIKDTCFYIGLTIGAVGIVYFMSKLNIDCTIADKICGIILKVFFGFIFLIAFLLVTWIVIDWFQTKINEFKQNLKD